tara:strand:- start:1154 stop:1741 length:588 start_codon:yes stop_codon:yes gene_type:complete
MTHILNHNEIFVKEQVRAFKFGNVYDYFDKNKNRLGQAREENITGFRKLVKMTSMKWLLPFDFSLYDAEDKKVVTLSKRSLFVPKIKIIDENGEMIGKFISPFTFLKPKIDVYDANGEKFAQVKGNLVGWTFKIMKDDEQIGQVTKKFAGLAKEYFTTADNYLFQYEDKKYTENQKKILCALPGCIDMLFKESKS